MHQAALFALLSLSLPGCAALAPEAIPSDTAGSEAEPPCGQVILDVDSDGDGFVDSGSIWT